MKEKIHPRYFQVEVRCACGNVIKTGSTKKEFSIAVCSNCHPFYTGAEKLLDAAGRVERFQKRFAWTGDKVKAEADKPKDKAAKGAKPLAPVESRARGNRAKAGAAPAAGEGKKKAEAKAAEAAEPKKLDPRKLAEPKAEAAKEAEPKAEAAKETEPKAEPKKEAEK
jgi:large subunit ribosomal protein L31